MKNISFLSENFQFLEVKFSIYMNRHVFVMGPSFEGILSICSKGSSLLNKMAAMPIYGEKKKKKKKKKKKTLKNLLLQNQESFKAEPCYRALGTQGHPSLFK